MPILKTINLRKEYYMGGHLVLALDGVDFKVEKGEFIAIMGPSGSGKSTLLHLLGGLDTPSKGEVNLAGQNLSQLTEYQATLARRHNVGFVFQFFNLLPTLTAEENILLPLIIDGKNPKKYEDWLWELLSLVGLLDRKSHKPDQLSGGEQQRVAIARALITKPAILLADEPTGNLDSKTGTAIMELIRKTSLKLEQTVVLVTHDPKAATFAQKVIFLRDGKIIQSYEPDPYLKIEERLSGIMEIMQTLEV
ncbi:MAG: ABC transporter ATP-binding protein [Anaerolineales bacterium]|jgi:putative ABC transport system ATP-binding protein